MAVSDRIAVMNGGVIQHIGKPKDIYQRPANTFVSTFIGRTNMMEADLVAEGGKVFLDMGGGYRPELLTVAENDRSSGHVQVSVRPEELLLSTDPKADGISAVVDDAVFLGLNTHYFVTLDNGLSAEIIQESTIEETLSKGARIKLTVNTDKVNVFTADGSRNILTGVKNDLNS